MKPRKLGRIFAIILTTLLIYSAYRGYAVAHRQYREFHDLPRNEEVALFDPHRSTFTCNIETAGLLPFDAEANEWFLEALALEDPETWEEDRNYKKIVGLTRKAAERRHWKAMLNLASLYLDKRDPPNGEMEALALVEQSMRLRVPAAYDRMGTYYMESVGVSGDATKAYAFWQKAADVGSPQAMVFLGEKLAATWDNPREDFWANLPVATKMLECALAQGYGPAADMLAFNRLWTQKSDGTPSNVSTSSTREHALQTTHQGVKLGCVGCARMLSGEFRNPIDEVNTSVPHIDLARSERYTVFYNALEGNPLLRLPNLDKVLPLPPAALPPWNGDKQALIDAAKGVMPRPPKPPVTEASQRKGRYFLDAAYDLRPSGETTAEAEAPFAGYWQATAPAEPAHVQAWLADTPPGLYRPGEAFDPPRSPQGAAYQAPKKLVWRHFLTVHHTQEAVMPRGAAHITREIDHKETRLSVGTHTPCPATGIWQPWLPSGHPLQQEVNQPWRQAWLNEGQTFPDLLIGQYSSHDLKELKWHLLDSTPPDIDKNGDAP